MTSLRFLLSFFGSKMPLFLLIYSQNTSQLEVKVFLILQCMKNTYTGLATACNAQEHEWHLRIGVKRYTKEQWKHY